MEMHERIKELRKNYLHLSQTDFGNKLGVSRSVINNIERNVLARPEQKLSLIKLICKEFSVNEDWLINGNEPILMESDTFSLDEFAKQRGATATELQILKTYFELDPNTRQMLVEHFQKGLASTPAKDDPSVEDLEAEYKKSILNSVQKEDSTVSNTINDIDDIVANDK